MTASCTYTKIPRITVLFCKMKRSGGDLGPHSGPAERVRLGRLALEGFLPNADYSAAVEQIRQLDDYSLVGFRRILSKKQSTNYFPVTQTSRRGEIPAGFADLISEQDPVAYALRALTIASPFDSMAPRLPDDLQAAVRRTVELGEAASAWRLSRLAILREISQSLRSLSDRINMRRPAHVAWAGGPTAHPAFVAAVVEALNWPDVSLAVDYFVRGLAVVGEAPDTGLFRARSDREMRRAGPKISVSELVASNIRWTAILMTELPAQFVAWGARNDIDALRLHSLAWRATIDEVQADTARGPFTRTEMDRMFGYGRWRASRRFGVPKGEDAVRPCDDETQSGHNSAFVSRHVLANCPVDFPAAVGRAFYDAAAEIAGAVQSPIGAAREDVPSAYRIAPAATPELTVVALVSPKSGRLFFFLTRGMNFGLSAAAQQFCRLPALVVALSRRLLAIPSDFYIDDLQVVETLVSRGISTGLVGLDEFPGSAHSSFVEITTVFMPLSDPKRLMWSSVPSALGVQSDFLSTHLDGVVRQRVAPQTCSKSLALAQQVLGSGELSPSLAGSLRGKFGYIFSLGSGARAVLSVIGRRQYALVGRSGLLSGVRWALDTDLHQALGFIVELLQGDLPDLVFPGPRHSISPVVVFSDASWSPPFPPSLIGSGRVAFVVFVPGRDLVIWAAQDVPEAVLLRLHGFRPRSTHIIPLEAIAMFSPLFCPALTGYFQGADVLWFGDNQTVNFSARKGYSTAPDVARLVSSWSLRGVELACRSWLHWVPSEFNIADPPSRPTVLGLSDDSSLLALGFPLLRVDFVFPSSFSWREF